MNKYQNLLWQIETECEKWDFKRRKSVDLKSTIEASDFYEKGKSKELDGFWIEEDVGNNAFVFENGKRLFVPPLHYVGEYRNTLLQKGTNIVFRDKDENGHLIKSVGLENVILTQGKKTGLPIYVVDNHNWAFYCWAEFLRLTPLEGGRGVFPQDKEDFSTTSFYSKAKKNSGRNDATKELNQLPLLIHIDAHKDEGECVLNKKIEQHDLSEIREITKKLKVSNYISAAIQSGLIQEQFLSFTESKDFVNYEQKFELLKKDSQNIILNVDIDIFDPEVSLISLEEKVRLICYFITKADLITFATSPGFIDQNLAIEITKIFLKYL